MFANVSTFEDLDIVFDSSPKWKRHITTIVNKSQNDLTVHEKVV